MPKRERVPLRQALFGPTLARNRLRAPDPYVVAHGEELSSGFFGWSAVTRQSSGVVTLREEGGGFSSCDEFTQCGIQKKKKKNNKM